MGYKYLYIAKVCSVNRFKGQSYLMNKLKMPGEWHNYIQNLFPCEWQEICSQDKSRRADVMNSDKKIVLEIQHSY